MWPTVKQFPPPAGAKSAALVMTGAINPMHLGHAEMLHMAANRLLAAGYHVRVAYASPSHDGYVQPKAKKLGTPGLSAAFRLEVAQRAVEADPLVAVASWEALQPGQWPDFPVVARALAKEVPAGEQVFYVCGTDHATRCGLTSRGMGRGIGLVIVPRAGDVLPSERHKDLIYIAKPAEGEAASFSSTKVRAAIESGDHETVATMCGAQASAFLLRPSAEEYERYSDDYAKLGVEAPAALNTTGAPSASSSQTAEEDAQWFTAPPTPLTEPMIYLSEKQSSVVKAKLPSLKDIILPAWAPQRLIANDLGFSPQGIQKALASLDGTPYLWATELENVHDLWVYDEPALTLNGRTYKDSEAYYHSQKPRPFDGSVWEELKDDVMRRALLAKLKEDPSLKGLLKATGNHPLLALKPDTYWGYDPFKGGRNRLAELWMEIRAELLEEASASSIVVGISGCSRSGKGRLSKALKAALEAKGDREVAIVGQDTYWKGPRYSEHAGRMSHEEPSCTDHDAFAAMIAEKSATHSIVIAEGFQLLHSEKVRSLLTHCYHLELDKETAKYRRTQAKDHFYNPNPLSAVDFEELLWPAHERYVKESVEAMGEQADRLKGMHLGLKAPSTQEEVDELVERVVQSVLERSNVEVS